MTVHRIRPTVEANQGFPTMAVTFKINVPLTVPSQALRRAGIKEGDKLEFKVSRRAVTIVPAWAPDDDTAVTPEEAKDLRRRLKQMRQGGTETFGAGQGWAGSVSLPGPPKSTARPTEGDPKTRRCDDGPDSHRSLPKKHKSPAGRRLELRVPPTPWRLPHDSRRRSRHGDRGHPSDLTAFR